VVELLDLDLRIRSCLFFALITSSSSHDSVSNRLNVTRSS
jgi:hypothetical protein